MQGFPGAADLTQLHATMQAIEQACSAIEMNVNLAAAEATICALRQSSRPYLSCKFIMENSQLPIARFQAAGAIWNAALQEWGHLTYEEKKSLIIFCLQYVMEHTTATDAYVQAKVSAVAAQLLKRGWMEFSSVEKEAVFTQVKNAVLGIHGLDAQYSGLNFLESLVSEFSPSTSSAMGLPTEFHDQCRSLMEAYYLKSFYCWAQDAAMRMTDKVICCDASIKEDKIYSASLRLMFQILNWDFKDSTDSANRKSRQDVALLKKYDRTLVQPGQAWTDILITSGHITWLLGVYGISRRNFSDDVLWFDSPLAVSSRQLIVQLCSLYGTVFPSDNGHTQQRYLLQILDAIIQWIFPPDDIINAIKNGQSESEMLDGCHALLSIATLCETTMMFDNLLKSLRPYGTLHLLSMLTSEVVNVAAGNNEDTTWCSEALDILLETWNILLVCVDCDKNTILEEGRGTCANLFNLIVDTHLKVAASTAFDDDDNYDHFRASVSTRDERLNSYALIARTAADCTLPFLIHHFSERVSSICQEKERTDPTRTLEELYWLLLMSGHILADSGEGETAMVPEALQASFAGISETVHHPVVVLSWAIIKFCERCLDPDMRTAFFSPRLLEAAVWFLARWAGTYLMSSKPVSNHQDSFARGTEPTEKTTSGHVLCAFAGETSHGKTILDTFVRISITTLISYPGETELQTLTCCQLLPALVNRKNICKHLVTLNSWQSLSNAFANDRILFSLSSRLQRFLAETLVRSASVIEEPSLLNGFVRDLMEPVTAYLTDMSSKNDLKAVAQLPDALLLVICLVERLRGAARATEPRTQKAIFNMALAVMNPLLILMDIYKDEAIVISLTLKFGVDLVDGQVVFLSPEDTRILVGFCMRMLQIYSGHNARKISLSLSGGLLNEAKTEKYKDLRALLKLLTNLCTKDLVDFSSAPVGEDIDIAQVVYFGLHIILPLMSLELLKFPKLSFQYFSLLSHMLEVYPEKVAQLSAESFGCIVGTIDWGIHQQDLEVVSMCLRAVDALASYHYKERSAGKEGLGGHASVSLGSGGKSAEGILRHFLRLLMQMLLFEDFSTDLHGAAADCLLPLILCEQDLYQSLLQELVERQESDTLKLRLATAFKCLTSSNQLDPSLNRINRQRFRKNFHKFLVDVSGFLRTK